MKKYSIGAIVPHLKCFGGIRRFLEIGNEFVSRGYNYTIFSGAEQSCNWFKFNGSIKSWESIKADMVLVGDPPSFKVLPKTTAKQIFIYVIGGEDYFDQYQQVYNKYPFILNNKRLLQKFPNAEYVVEGGVNTKTFIPKKPKVLYYPRHSHIEKEIGDLVELIPMENLDNEQLKEVYHQADYFVSWEERGAWSNTSAEAVASGLTVITNGRNCEPFIDKVIKVKNLRDFFASPMKEFDWEIVVDKLVNIFDSYEK